MAFKKQVAPPVAEMRNLIQGVAKNFVDRAYGPKGPEWGTLFSDIEELAVQVGRAVSQQMLDQALQRQANEPAPATDQVCPTCRGPVQPGEPEPRIMTTRAGDAAWQEPQGHCPRCRRAFFPSVQAAGD
jgi:hypothetical protein